ncbi:diacylglycerol kinase (ATP) [Aurantimicrobium minutum]|uniref:diacylglycerol/lipid kinase family protein n=1 Tax=Aurantimicrobium minutum TaxID=708131 RepID=UPI0024763470|nr:diacylglycerol kinase family protein [Aurantimicrobium minutum]MDH6532853.1 diacylglycerol kinase (ATP) [Aurantimicrobium minutum]
MSVLPAAVVFNPALPTLDTLRKIVAAAQKRAGLPETLWIPASFDNGGLPASVGNVLSKVSVVLVAGGDGLVRSVAEIIQGTDTPLGIIPMGTGNLLARNLGLPVVDRTKCVSIAFGKNHRQIDLARAELVGEETTTHVFSVMAGIGLDADMAAGASISKKKRFGWLAYVRPIVRSVAQNRQQEMSFILDDQPPVIFKAHTVIVGNCGTLTANLLLMPDAVLDDGLLNIVVLNPKYLSGWTHIWSRLAIGGALNQTKAGRRILDLAPEIKTLRYDQLRSVTITLKERQTVQLDGDSYGKINRMTVSVLPKVLTVKVPS